MKAKRPPCSPCYECPDRTIGCHGDCEKYEDYTTERIELKKEIGRMTRIDRAPEALMINGVQRRRKKYSGKKPPIR